MVRVLPVQTELDTQSWLLGKHDCSGDFGVTVGRIM